jgi:serine/threonine protein phosphatase PrpC
VGWRWAAASEIGTSHLRLGTRKQDAIASFQSDDRNRVLCAIVCDGAGSAEHGGEGASVICRTMTNALRRHFVGTATLPTDDDIWSWVDLARDRLSVAADKRAKPRRAFASTLVMLAATGEAVLTAHVGDGAVVGRSMSTTGQPCPRRKTANTPQ